MKSGQYIKENKLLKQGVSILMDKLGPIETFRFLSFPSPKRIESLKRHQKWQAELDKDEFLEDLFGRG